MLFYQVDFTVDETLPDALGYFHAQFRRANPCPLGQDYVILDGVERPGTYLGTVIGVRERMPSLCQRFFTGPENLRTGAQHDHVVGRGRRHQRLPAWGQRVPS